MLYYYYTYFIIIIIIVVVVVVVDDDTYYWVYLSSDHPFQVCCKRKVRQRILLQSATAFLLQCDKCSYKVPQFNITKCDRRFFSNSLNEL